MSVILVAAGMAGCGEDAASSVQAVPWSDGETVIVEGGERRVVPTPSGSDCIDLGDGQCVSPQQVCPDGGRAEVFLDDQGQLVRTVCYPSSDAAQIEFIDGSLKPEQDGVVFVLDGDADGADIENNVELVGNSSTLVGHGPDASLIGGNLKVVGNDAVISGVTIDGEVDLEGQNATLSDCVITGNLHIQGSGALVSGCTVFGDVDFDASGGAMLANLVQRTFRIREATTLCSGNRAFTDADADGVVSSEELGDLLECSPQ